MFCIILIFLLSFCLLIYKDWIWNLLKFLGNFLFKLLNVKCKLIIFGNEFDLKKLGIFLVILVELVEKFLRVEVFFRDLGIFYVLKGLLLILIDWSEDNLLKKFLGIEVKLLLLSIIICNEFNLFKLGRDLDNLFYWSFNFFSWDSEDRLRGSVFLRFWCLIWIWVIFLFLE